MRFASFGLSILCALVACGGRSHEASSIPKPSAATSVPFDYVGQSWIRVPANVGGVSTHLMFDTGGGLTILSDALCTKMKCVPDGSFSGKRMSGQSIDVKMARVPSIEIAGHRVENARVAVLDTSSLLHPDIGVDGVAALDVMRGEAVTIDYPRKQLVLEDAASRDARRKNGITTKVRIEDEGPSTVVYLPLSLSPEMKPLEMEVDTGSFDLILDERFMAALGIDPNAPTTRRVDGKDETANAYVRYFSKLPRALGVANAPTINAAAGKTVMFQRIIHDGLVGHDFLSSHVVTFDLRNAEMTFGEPSR